MARLKDTFTPPDWNKNKNGAQPVEVASDSYKPKTWASYWVDVVFSDNLYYLWAPMTVIGIVIGSNVELIGNFKHVPLFCLGIFFGLTVFGFLEKKLESIDAGGGVREPDNASNSFDTEPDAAGIRTITRGVISPSDIFND
jgi:hypothetical protein